MARALVIFAGGMLGTAARVSLLDWYDDDLAGLAVVNLLGCLLLGAISGWFGQRVTLLRLFLAVGGVASFTSWSSLALQGIASPSMVALVAAETVAGICFAGLGHVIGRAVRRRRGR